MEKKVKSRTGKEKEDHQWQFKFLIEQFSKESDRAAVILVASILDEILETLIKSRLTPVPTAQDSLFDNATSPLSSFSSKIDMAFRIGLISGKLARDIHIIRKIRNSFAHDVYGCSFENGSVKSRVRELENSASSVWVKQRLEVERNDNILEGTRGKFLWITSALIWTISDLIKKTGEIEEANKEWFYGEDL